MHILHYYQSMYETDKYFDCYRYRGAAPIQSTIMNGDNETGVSIIDLASKEFDAGNIWYQERHFINPYPDFGHLEEELAILSGDSILRVVDNFNTFRVR